MKEVHVSISEFKLDLSKNAFYEDEIIKNDFVSGVPNYE